MGSLIIIIVVGLALVYLLSRPRKQPLAKAALKDMLSKSIGGIHSIDALDALVPPDQGNRIWSEVLTELLQRLGTDRDTLEDILQAQGLEPPSDRRHQERKLDRRQAREPDLQHELEKALVVGITLARVDDDYARVGDDYASDTNRDDMLRARADEIESALFDTKDRAQYEFYAKGSLVLQDMLEDTNDDERKRYILRLLDRFEEQLEQLGERMDALISSLRAAEHSSYAYEWGSSEDRKLYYFMMGVTNTLRKRKVGFPALDALYRAKGLGYNVEEAYDRVALECPVLNTAKAIGIQNLLAYNFGDIKALVRSTLPEE